MRIMWRCAGCRRMTSMVRTIGAKVFCRKCAPKKNIAPEKGGK